MLQTDFATIRTLDVKDGTMQLEQAQVDGGTRRFVDKYASYGVGNGEDKSGFWHPLREQVPAATALVPRPTPSMLSRNASERGRVGRALPTPLSPYAVAASVRAARGWSVKCFIQGCSLS